MTWKAGAKKAYALVGFDIIALYGAVPLRLGRRIPDADAIVVTAVALRASVGTAANQQSKRFVRTLLAPHSRLSGHCANSDSLRRYWVGVEGSRCLRRGNLDGRSARGSQPEERLARLVDDLRSKESESGRDLNWAVLSGPLALIHGVGGRDRAD